MRIFFRILSISFLLLSTTSRAIEVETVNEAINLSKTQLSELGHPVKKMTYKTFEHPHNPRLLMGYFTVELMSGKKVQFSTALQMNNAPFNSKVLSNTLRIMTIRYLFSIMISTSTEAVGPKIILNELGEKVNSKIYELIRYKEIIKNNMVKPGTHLIELLEFHKKNLRGTLGTLKTVSVLEGRTVKEVSVEIEADKVISKQQVEQIAESLKAGFRYLNADPLLAEANPDKVAKIVLALNQVEQILNLSNVMGLGMTEQVEMALVDDHLKRLKNILPVVDLILENIRLGNSSSTAQTLKSLGESLVDFQRMGLNLPRLTQALAHNALLVTLETQSALVLKDNVQPLRTECELTLNRLESVLYRGKNVVEIELKESSEAGRKVLEAELGIIKKHLLVVQEIKLRLRGKSAR